MSAAVGQGSLLLPSTRAHFEIFPKDNYIYRLECAAALKIPGAATYCPDNLESDAAIGNYYIQEPMMLSLASTCKQCDLPNAMYVDAVDYGGTIRTGLRRVSDPARSPVCDQFDWTTCTSNPSCESGFTANGDKTNLGVSSSNGSIHSPCIDPLKHHFKCCREQPESQNSARFGYVATFILANLQRTCRLRADDDPLCVKIQAIAQSHLNAFPVMLWEDPSVARLVSWPANVSNSTCPKCHP